MAIKYDLKAIDAKLESLPTQSEKLNYLNNYLFEIRKKKAEFITTDYANLERLKGKTQGDYEKYHAEFDAGRLVYFSNDKWEAISTERIGFENIALLKERLELENTINAIEGDILLIESIIEKVKNENPAISSDNPKVEIEHLKYNALTLPESIYKYFCSLGKYNDTVGRQLPPYSGRYSFKENGISHHCFILDTGYELFNIALSKGDITDENGTVLNSKTVYEYLVSYSKGFEKGYNDFVNTISKTELFNNSNNDLAYKIFERVYPAFLVGKNGSLSSYKGKFIDGKTVLFITKEHFFEKGYEGGEYYKAWELILKSPMLFKDFFDAQMSEKVATPAVTNNNQAEITQPLAEISDGFTKEHSDIFINATVWNVFKKLVEVIVVPNKNKLANFSAIFQTLIEKKLVHLHRHRVFLDYCDKWYGTDFSGKTKLNSQTSSHTVDIIKGYLISSNLIEKESQKK